MWKFIDLMNKHNWFYRLIGRRLSAKRKEKIKKMTNQKKLYKIFLKEQIGWLEALHCINAPVMVEEILRSEEFQPRLSKFGSYFKTRTELIEKLDNNIIKQELYNTAIEQEIENIKKSYSRLVENNIFGHQTNGNQILWGMQNRLRDAKYLSTYIDKIENSEQRDLFFKALADTLEKAPSLPAGIAGSDSYYRDKKEFEQELLHKV
jgi:hypothetical protein